jgi:hypothetical protein
MRDHTLIAEIVAHLAYSSIQQKNQTKLVFFFNNEKQIFQLGNMGSLLVATETLPEHVTLNTSHHHLFFHVYISVSTHLV